MITFKTGNIFNENVEAIVNTVNCVGVMGRGIALQFKKQYPENFKAYQIACKHHEIEPGKMFICETDSINKPKFIVNFPTKKHWKGKSRMEYIETGLIALAEEIKNRNIQSIAIPPLGSGLGGLPWRVVKQCIINTLSKLNDVSIIVYEPHEHLSEIKSGNKSTKTQSTTNMTPGRAALICLIDCYLNGLMDPFITLLETHKLLYFMQESGEVLQLKFKKAIYGPYAENLRHVLNVLEGHYLKGYEDGGDKPDKNIELLPGALEKATSFLENSNEISTRKHIEKVTELVDGFETSFGLELLSTVHWVVEKEQISNFEEIVNKVYAWNTRKKQFSPRQIKVAYNTLERKGWIN